MKLPEWKALVRREGENEEMDYREIEEVRFGRKKSVQGGNFSTYQLYQLS